MEQWALVLVSFGFFGMTFGDSYTVLSLFDFEIERDTKFFHISRNTSKTTKCGGTTSIIIRDSQ
jgi:hypothetical protein